MASQNQYNIQNNIIQYMGMKDMNFYPFSNSPFNQIYNNQNIYVNSTKGTNDISSTDADSYSYQNPNLNFNFDKPVITDNRITVKKSNEFIAELFKVFSEKNSLCNFTLFEKNIDINMKLEKKELKKLTLKEYFNCFNEASVLCLGIPFLDKKCNISHNIFNPTLSSMVLLLKPKNIRKEKINTKCINNNFSILYLSDDLIELKFNEKDPPYNRDIIESKIDDIHKILGKKKILIDDIIKEKSYFSILWTPADTYKIKTSFLSYYTFDFKLVGTLAIKVDNHAWFTIFCNDSNHYKDFKKEYLNKVITVEKFIKNCHNVGDEDKLDLKFFSHDYKRFLYNY